MALAVPFYAGAVRFTGENSDEVLALQPEALSLQTKVIGPGNVELWIAHSEIPERLLVGHWAVKIGGTILFLPDRTFELLNKWTIRRSAQS